MKKIFESDWHGENESAERVHIYEFTNEEEYWEFGSLSFNKKCEYFGVREDDANWIMPGSLYHRYDFNNSGAYVVMYETAAYNV